MLPLVVAIHGILTNQTNASWPDRLAAAWADEAIVLKKEYSAGPLPLWNRWVKNPRLAKSLANEIELYKREVFFVSHSNGTDIALDCIKELARRGIKTAGAVFIGSVLNSDVDKSGVYDMVNSGALGRAVAWSSKGDGAIGWGRHSFGYGGLGCEGWRRNGRPYERLDTVTTRWFRGGHGSYFEPDNLARTFQLLRLDLRSSLAMSNAS